MVAKRKKAKTKPDKAKKKKRKLTPRQKYAKGGRVEAYTMGEAIRKPKWPH